MLPVIRGQREPPCITLRIGDLLSIQYPSRANNPLEGNMSNRRKNTMDIREILNQLRSGTSDRQISQDMGIARQTVKRYREWAKASGLLASEPAECGGAASAGGEGNARQTSAAEHIFSRAIPGSSQRNGRSGSRGSCHLPTAERARIHRVILRCIPVCAHVETDAAQNDGSGGA